MVEGISRRLFLTLIAAGTGVGAVADAPVASLRPVLRGAEFHKRAIPAADEIIDAARLRGRVHFAVADTTSGAMLEQLGAVTALPPASVAKTITALYALDVLGPDHRFDTRLVATGDVIDGVLHGDLVLSGGGDPTLDSNDLQTLAQALKASGLREVRGRFLVYEGALHSVDTIDPTQPDHVGYNPAVSGLALNFNRVHFEWRRGAQGYDVTMDARAEQLRPAVAVARMKVVDREVPVYTYAAQARREDWTVARAALGKGGARWLPVRKPGLYAGDVFRTLSRAQGILLGSAEPTTQRPGGKILARYHSPPLKDILRDMLKYSTNLTAEMAGLAATRARTGRNMPLQASAAEMSRWAATTLGMKDTQLVDHSGLGDASRMTPQDMVRALVAMRGTGFREILKPIKLRDTKGRPQPDHPVRVHAKTGTLNFVSSLAGYVTAADGTEMAFAIMSADMEHRAALSRAERENPPGGRNWNARARRLQQALIVRWAALYGA